MIFIRLLVLVFIFLPSFCAEKAAAKSDAPVINWLYSTSSGNGQNKQVNLSGTHLLPFVSLTINGQPVTQYSSETYQGRHSISFNTTLDLDGAVVAIQTASGTATYKFDGISKIDKEKMEQEKLKIVREFLTEEVARLSPPRLSFYSEFWTDPKTKHFQKALEVLNQNKWGKKELAQWFYKNRLQYFEETDLMATFWKIAEHKSGGTGCWNEEIDKAYMEALGRLPYGMENAWECWPEFYLDDPNHLPPFDKLVANIEKRHGVSPRATLLDFEPKEGTEGTKVTITGKKMDKVQKVFFLCDHCAEAVIEKKSSGQIIVSAPKGDNTGPIFVVSQAPASVVSGSKDPFTYLFPPSIQSVRSPGQWPGDSVKVYGKYLANVTSVTMAGKPASVIRQESEMLIVGLPEDCKSGELVLTNKAGSVKTWLEVNTTPPEISRIEPSSGFPGDKVNIYGKNFDKVKEIDFGGRKVPAAFHGSNALTAFVPDAEPGRCDVTALTPFAKGTWENRFDIREKESVRKAREEEKRKKEEQRKREDEEEKLARKKREKEPEFAPPPPPPPPGTVAVKKKPPPPPPEEPVQWGTPPPEEPVTWRPPRREVEEEVGEPVSYEGKPCAANIPRYQQKGCVEAQEPQEEVSQPQTCERGTWSPTLKMCVE